MSELADLLALVDEAAPDALRAAAYLSGPQDPIGFELLDDEDHELVAAAFRRVVDFVADEARSRWASADAWLRYLRAVNEVDTFQHGCENRGSDDMTREERRLCDLAERTQWTLHDDYATERGTLRASAPRLIRYDPPAGLGPRLAAEWAALEADLALARQSCGWETR